MVGSTACGSPAPAVAAYSPGTTPALPLASLGEHLAESRLLSASLARDLAQARFDRLPEITATLRRRFNAIVDRDACRATDPAAFDALIAGLHSTLSRLDAAAAREAATDCANLQQGLDLILDRLAAFVR